jgi:hypothetical protein
MRGGLWEEQTEMKVCRSKQGGAGRAPNLMWRPVKPERNHIRLRGVGCWYYRKSNPAPQGVMQQNRMQVLPP